MLARSFRNCLTSLLVPLLLATVTTTTVTTATVARAGSVTSALKYRDGTFASNPGGAFTILAYSESKGVMNAATTLTSSLGNAPMTYPDAINAPTPGVGNLKVTPTVGLIDFPKVVGDSDTSSKTGTALGTAMFNSSVGGGPGAQVIYLKAGGNTVAGVQGIAVGQAKDPVSVSPGSYDFSPAVDFSMQDFPTDPFTTFEIEASDSHLTNPLFDLTIESSGPISSVADLQFAFTSDPSLGLNDSLVLSNLIAALSAPGGITGGIAALTDYTLFDTTYNVSAPTTFNDFVTAATSSVPEPASALLALTGAVIFFTAGYRSRRGAR